MPDLGLRDCVGFDVLNWGTFCKECFRKADPIIDGYNFVCLWPSHTCDKLTDFDGYYECGRCGKNLGWYSLAKA